MKQLVAQGTALWQRVQTSRPMRAFSRFTEVGGSVLTGGMSYQALFGVFAALWVGFGIAGTALRDRPDLMKTLVKQLDMYVPGLVGTHGAVSLDTLLNAPTLTWTTGAAGLGVVWVAVSWFTGTRRSIRIIFDLEVKQYRNAVLLKLRDFVLGLGFFVAILLSAALTVLSSNLLDGIAKWIGLDSENWLLTGLGTVTRYGVMFVFDVLVLMAIHRYLAEVRVRRGHLLFGCMLGGAALLGIKLLGTALLGGATRNPLLATFAVIAALLIWFNLLCRALLLTSSWIATGLNPKMGLPAETPQSRKRDSKTQAASPATASSATASSNSG